MYSDGKERRGAVRRRVLKGAIMAFNERHSALPCTVRDLSTSGARIRADGTAYVPDEFILIIELDGTEADCSVVSRRGKDMGVKFTSPLRAVKPRRAQIVAALRRS